MGIVYQIKLQDDFNWEYVGTTKRKRMNKFIKEFGNVSGIEPELIAQWYGHAIFDLSKRCPGIDEYKEIILSNCDTAFYWSDYNPYEVIELI
jgi:hypothetical protein